MSIYSDQNKQYTSELVRLSNKNLIALSYQKLNVGVDDSVKALMVPIEAKYAEISVESSNVTTIPMRYLILGDKTPPTTTDGLALRDNTFFDITGYPNLINFRIIRTGADTSVLHIQYYK